MDMNNLSVEQINQLRDEEILKIDKLKFVFNILKQFPDNYRTEKHTKIEPENLDKLAKSIKKLSVLDHIRLDNGMNLLGLDADPIEITYSEHKVVLEYLIDNILLKLDPILTFVDSVKKDKPELFDNKIKRSEITILEEKRQKLYFELLDLKLKKCKLLQNCAETKMGPDLVNKLNILSMKYNINQTKVDLLNKYIVHEFNSRRGKALKELNTYLDAELEQK